MEKEKTYVVKTVEQAKVLSDPLRLRILREFVAEPRTTKQVADRLGEKPTRLYRHVDALREVGLLQVKEERPKRGTVERYLRAIAGRFAVDPGLFEQTETSDERGHMLDSIFRDVQTAAEHAVATMRHDDENRLPLVAKFQGRGTRAQFADLRKKMAQWLEDCQSDHNDTNDEDYVEFGGLVALYVTNDKTDD